MATTIRLSHRDVSKLYNRLIKIHNSLNGNFDIMSLDIAIQLQNYINTCDAYDMNFDGMNIEISDDLLWLNDFIYEHKEKK